MVRSKRLASPSMLRAGSGRAGLPPKKTPMSKGGKNRGKRPDHSSPPLRTPHTSPPPPFPSLLPLLLLLFLAFPIPPSPLPSDALSGRGGGYTTTRREAIISFLKELQMPEGGFIDTLYYERNGQGSPPTEDAVCSLDWLEALDEIDCEGVVDFTLALQRPGGGFVVELESPPEMADVIVTEDSLEVLRVVGRLDAIDRGEVASWVWSCYRGDGTFNVKPGLAGDPLWCTCAAVRCLTILGEEIPQDVREKIITFCLDNYCEGGGFALGGGTPTISDTRWFLETLQMVDGVDRLSSQQVEDTIDYLMGFYNPQEGYFDVPYVSTVEYVFSSLYILGGLGRINRTATINFILSCQSPVYGGFVGNPDEVYDGRKNDAESVYSAVYSLMVLDALDALEEEFEVWYPPLWQGDDTPPQPWKPETSTPQVPPWLLPALAAGLVALLVAVFAVNYLNKRRREKRRVKVVRRTRR